MTTVPGNMWMTLPLLRSSLRIHKVKFRWQTAVVEKWSSNNKLQLNADKGLTSAYLLSYGFLLTNYKMLHASLSDLLLQS